MNPLGISAHYGKDTRLANLAAQEKSATLPQPALPGKHQTMPVQLKK